jgi:hypothetical protein
MVNIRSIATSPRSSRHGQEIEGEATSHFRAGQSHRTNARVITTAVEATTATTWWQHSATRMAMTPPDVGPKGTLEATCTLFHNPLGSDASPAAVEQ